MRKKAFPGSSIQRNLVRGYFQRKLNAASKPRAGCKCPEYWEGKRDAWQEAIVWLDAGPKRTAKKKGGLGRR